MRMDTNNESEIKANNDAIVQNILWYGEIM